MNISGEAIESALEAFWANEDEPYITAMRRALEAAAPHLMADQQSKLDALSVWAGRSKSGYYDEAQDDVVQILSAGAGE